MKTQNPPKPVKSVSNPKPQHKGERIVTLTFDDQSWRYGVSWWPEGRMYRVRAIDEGWVAHVCSADVPGVLTAHNIAVVAAEGGAK